MSTPDPLGAVAALVAFLEPGEALPPLPHKLAVALAELGASASAAGNSDSGTGPGGDFTARDLMARYSKSASWVRQRLADKSWGEGYRLGRERVARRADVLAYDERLRGSRPDAPPAQPSGAQDAPSGARKRKPPLSLVEKRRERLAGAS